MKNKSTASSKLTVAIAMLALAFLVSLLFMVNRIVHN